LLTITVIPCYKDTSSVMEKWP